MAVIKNIFDFLNDIAPIKYSKSGDNVGHILGRSENEAKKIIISLDITDDVITEAIDEGASLVVSHHPLFFSLDSITDSDVTGRRILKLVENRIGAICMHTNLDAANGGVNDVLAKAVGIENPVPFASTDQSLTDVFPMGRLGNLAKPTTLQDFLSILKSTLDADGIRYYDAGRNVSKIAVMGGSGGSQFDFVLEHGCDTFVTADLKYNLFLDARELGLNLIDAGHFNTENVIIAPLAKRLSKEFPDIEVMVSKKHGNVIRFY